MRRVRILILDRYLSRVMNLFGRLRSIQIAKVMEREKEAPEEKTLERYSDLSNNLNRLVELLGIEDEKVGEVTIGEKSSIEYLDELEADVNSIITEATSVSERLDEMSKEKAILQSDEFAVDSLNMSGIEAKWLGISDFIYVAAGFLDPGDEKELRLRIVELTGKEHLILTEPVKDNILAVVVTLSSHQNDVEGLLRGLKFDSIELTGKGIGEIRGRLESIGETEDMLRRGLDKLRDEKFRDILIAREMAQIEKNILEMVLRFGRTERVYAIEGWIPARELDGLIEEIKNASDGCAVIHTYEPKPDDNVPVSFENPGLIKPFESIVEMFGLPSYTEIDPTPILAITFPLLFGLMFGDVGHGAILALAGFGMKSFKSGNKSYWNYGMILMYCGIAAVIFGFLYGSLFGNEEILSHVYKGLGIGRPHPTEHGELWVLWMSPPNQIMEMIGIALFVGMLHMGLGLVVSAANKIREGGYGTLTHSLSKLWFLVGEIAIIAVVFPFTIPGFEGLREGVPVTDILLIGILIPATIMLLSEIKHTMHNLNMKKLLEVVGSSLFEIFEMFSMFLSNTISYSRLLILAVVHAMMMVAIYTIAGLDVLSGTVIVGPLVIIFGNMLVIGLEGLIVFIHTIRLHFYEWFTKFYVAEGVRYEPFVVDRRYTKLA